MTSGVCNKPGFLRSDQSIKEVQPKTQAWAAQSLP
jgi:hypothetical protein